MSDRPTPVAPGLAALLLAAVALALSACGDDSEETPTTLPTTETAPESAQKAPLPKVEACRSDSVVKGRFLAVNVDCSSATAVITGWLDDPGCAPAAGESRSSCTIEGFRCLAAESDQGVSVTCARRNRTIGFLAPRR